MREYRFASSKSVGSDRRQPMTFFARVYFFSIEPGQLQEVIMLERLGSAADDQRLRR